MTTQEQHEPELEKIDYLANRFAHGVYPGGVRYMFSEEDWLTLKDAVRATQDRRVLEKLQELRNYCSTCWPVDGRMLAKLDDEIAQLQLHTPSEEDPKDKVCPECGYGYAVGHSLGCSKHPQNEEDKH